MSIDSILPTLLQQSTTLAAFLGNYAVHSTALLGVAWACTGRRSPLPVGTRESVWRGAMVLGVATAAAATAFPALGVVPRSLAERLQSVIPSRDKKSNITHLTTVGAAAAPRREVAVAPWLPGGSAASPTILPVDHGRFAPPVPGDGYQQFPSPIPAGPVTSTLEPIVMQDTMTAPSSPIRWGLWVSGIWLAVAAAGLARLTHLRLALSKSLGPREPIGSTRLACLFDTLADEMGLTGQVRLTQSRRLATPVALPDGEVCIPTGILEALPFEQQRCILAHELAHVARHDPAWLLGARAIEAAFWFQPLNRVARRKLSDLSEFACDDAAAHSTSEGELAMANSLATAARWLGGETPALAAAMAAGPSTLVRRVERLLGNAEPKHLTGKGRLVLALPVLASLGVVSLSPSALADEGKPIPPPSPEAPASPATVKAPAPRAPQPPSVKHIIIDDGGGWEVPLHSAIGGRKFTSVPLTRKADRQTSFTISTPGGSPTALAGFGGGDDAYAFATGGKRNAIGIGVSPVDGALAVQLGLEPGTATVVDQVYDDSSAAKAGLKQFDIITAVDGQDASPKALREAIAAKKAGEPVSLEVRRGGQTLTIPVEVREVDGGMFGPLAGGFTFAPGPPSSAFSGEGLSEEILENLRQSMGPAFDPKLEEELRKAFGADFQAKVDEAMRKALESNFAEPRIRAFSFGSTPGAGDEAMRRAEEAFARARRAFPSPPTGGLAAPHEEMARALERMAEDQARLQEQLDRLREGMFSGQDALAAPAAAPASKLRSGYVDLLTGDIVKRITGKGFTGEPKDLEEAIRESARAALAASTEVTESISCNNDKCRGMISVEPKSYAEAIVSELAERHWDIINATKGGEAAVRAAVRAACSDNGSYKLTWEK